MTKPLLYAILLCTACQASAATLYRWVEPDGSITFSPEPPTTGVTFDSVQTGAAATESAATTASTTELATNTPRAPSASINTTAAALPELSVTRLTPQTEPRQGLSYAPNSSNAKPNSIVRSNVPAPAKLDAVAAQTQGDKVMVSNQKYSQCQELKKRVVSLEQRLRVDLTPDEVDNTIIAMVRYQDSYDKFCHQ